MTDKISGKELRRMVFNNIDENHSGSIDPEEMQYAPIFGLKEGDTKIKRQNFDKNLATEFLAARDANQEIFYKKTVDGRATIQTCYECNIFDENNDVDIVGNNNSIIVQHKDNHTASITNNGIAASLPDSVQDEQNDIGLCIECTVENKDNTINIKGKNNTFVYQDNQETIVIDSNKEDVSMGGKSAATIGECIECTEEKKYNHTDIVASNIKAIYQYGNNNDATINKDD